MTTPTCPKRYSKLATKSGIIHEHQRLRCKKCSRHQTIDKAGWEASPPYAVKAWQLYIAGVSYCEGACAAAGA